MHESLTLVPEALARRALGDRPQTVHMLVPPYAALGVGALRVLRVTPVAAGYDVTVGYDRYERLD
jgi:hypothetical protein